MASGAARPSSDLSGSGKQRSGKPRPKGRVIEYQTYIDGELKKTRSRVKWVDIGASLTLLAAGILGFLLFGALVDHWLFERGLSFAGRVVMCTVLVGGVAYHLLARFLPLLVRKVNPVYAAEAIERGQPMKNSLINFLLLRKQPHGQSEQMLEAMKEQAAVRLSAVPSDAPVDRSGLIRLGYVLCAVLIVLTVYAFVGPKDTFSSVGRVVAPWANIAAPTRVRIMELTPADVERRRDEFVDLKVRTRGMRAADQATVYYSASGKPEDDVALPLKSDDLATWTASLPGGADGLKQDLYYYVRLGDTETPRYRIRVAATPVITVANVRYEYPAYTELPPRDAGRQADLRGLEGSRVVITAETNQRIKSAYASFDGSRQRDLDFAADDSGLRAVGSFELGLGKDRSTPTHRSYLLRFANIDGQENPKPIEHKIEVVKDQSPEVRVTEPSTPEAQVLQLPLGSRLRITLAARDPDFKLADVSVVFERLGGMPLAEVKLLTEKHRTEFASTHEFEASRYGLKVGDRLTFRGRATDNKAPQPNVTETARYSVLITQGDGIPQPPPKADDRNQQQNGDSKQNGTQTIRPGENAVKQNDLKQGDGQNSGAQNNAQPEKKKSLINEMEEGQPPPQNGGGQNGGGQNNAPQPNGAPQDGRSNNPQGQPQQGQPQQGNPEQNGKPQDQPQQGGAGEGRPDQHGKPQQGDRNSDGGNKGSGDPSGSNQGDQADSNNGQGANDNKPIDPETNAQDAVKALKDFFDKKDGKQPEQPQTANKPNDGNGGNSAEDNKQARNDQPRNENGRDEKAGNEKAGNEKGDDQKSGNEKSGSEKGDHEKKGNEQGRGGDRQGNQGDKQPGMNSGASPNNEAKKNDGNEKGNDQGSPKGGQNGMGEEPTDANGKGQNEDQKPGAQKPDDKKKEGEGQPGAPSGAGQQDGNQSGKQGSDASKNGGSASGQKSDRPSDQPGSPGGNEGTRTDQPSDGNTARREGKNEGGREVERKPTDGTGGGDKKEVAGDKPADLNNAKPTDQTGGQAGAKPTTDAPMSGTGTKPKDGGASESAPKTGTANEGNPTPKRDGEQSNNGDGGRSGSSSNKPDPKQGDAAAKPKLGDKPEGEAPKASDNAGDQASNQNQKNAGQPGNDSSKEGTPQSQEMTKPRDNKAPGSGESARPEEGKSEEGKSPGHGKNESNTQSDSSGDLKGQGQKGGGMKSNKEGTGASGQNTPADQGGSAANEEGDSVAGNKPGDKVRGKAPKSGDPNESQPSGEKGDGSRTRAGGDQPQGDQPQADQAGGDGRAKPGETKPGEKSGHGSSSGSSQPNGNRPSGDQPAPMGGANNGDPQSDRKPGESRERDYTAQEAEAANLEYTKKVTDLTLQRLKSELDKGQVDPELLKKFGSREALEKFAKWHQEQLNKAKQAGAQGDTARKDLDEFYKGLGLRTGEVVQRGRRTGDDDSRDLRGAHRSEPPAKYRDRYNAYTQGFRETAPVPKAKPQP